MFFALLGALVASSTPTPAAPNRAPVTIVTSNKAAQPDLSAMFKMFDKFFPPQPDPDPARLALARTTVLGLLPPGTFGKAMGDMLGGMFERVLEMKESDFADMAALKSAKGAKATPPSNETLHQSLVAKDPYFDERMRLTRTAVEQELVGVSAIVEPKLRDRLARAVARRFDQRQLADINGFFATDSGKALGNQFLGMWFDPDLMRSMMATMPEMMIAMPGAIKRIEAATAHLPKPPKDHSKPVVNVTKPAP